MATANINPTQSTQVNTNLFSGNTWDGFRNSTAGLSIDTTPDSTTSGGTWVNRINFFGADRYLGRVMLSDYDLSGLPGGATITGLVLKLYGQQPSSQASTQSQIIFLEGTFDSSIAAGDLDSFTGQTSGWGASDVTEYSSPYGGDDWQASAYNEITLNSDAVSAANTQFAAGNRLKLYGIEYDNWYSDDEGFGKSVNFVANTGATNQIILTVTYSSGYGNDVSGIASANISSVNGIPLANISEVGGV